MFGLAERPALLNAQSGKPFVIKELT